MTPLNKDAVRFIAIHCAATPPAADIGADEIRKWHLAQGWEDIGYHFVIRRNGTVEPGRSLEFQGAHVQGHNHEAIGICLVGGINDKAQPDANFTDAQWASLESIVHLMLNKFPKVSVVGHRDFPGVTKACPSFDVKSWWAQHSGSE